MVNLKAVAPDPSIAGNEQQIEILANDIRTVTSQQAEAVEIRALKGQPRHETYNIVAAVPRSMI